MLNVSFQEEAIMISQDVINKLNAVCYEKLAEQFLPPNRGAASVCIHLLLF